MENQKFLVAFPGDHSGDSWGRMHWHSPHSKVLQAVPGCAGMRAMWLYLQRHCCQPLYWGPRRDAHPTAVPLSPVQFNRAQPALHMPGTDLCLAARMESSKQSLTSHSLSRNITPSKGSRFHLHALVVLGVRSLQFSSFSPWIDFNSSVTPRLLSLCWLLATMGWSLKQQLGAADCPASAESQRYVTPLVTTYLPPTAAKSCRPDL